MMLQNSSNRVVLVPSLPSLLCLASHFFLPASLLAAPLRREQLTACVEACKKSTAPGVAGPSPVSCPITLRAHYAISSTDLAYGQDLASLRKALSTQDDDVIEYAVAAGSATPLSACARYAMSGTHLAYGAICGVRC
eukprot:3941644-Rhodomonas_salina.4